MQKARLDDRLAVRILSVRELRYTRSGVRTGASSDIGDAAPTSADPERPHHVRAASGMAFVDGGRLAVVQDDAAYIGLVDGDHVDSLALPYAPGGRRRFEIALGNKLDKLDLEACVVVEGELWAFGSGSLPVRERVCRLPLASYAPAVLDAAPLYAALREAVGSLLNIEGVALIAGELWFCHRGNTGPSDPGPAVARVRLADVRASLERGAPPPVLGVERYDLGAIDGAALGFTDAVARGTGVLYLAAAEASPDAIDDGPVAGSQLGAIDAGGVRAAPLTDLDGAPIKAEAIALDPAQPGRAWIAADPDDPDRPSPLFEVELVGPW